MLTSFPLQFPQIDPVLLAIGPISIRWYSLAYIAGILFGWYYLAKLNKKLNILTKQQHDSILTYGIVGIILGGRAGYVLFYNFASYLNNPLEIFMVWKGGMSFHGGLIGLILATLLFARLNKVKFLPIMDMMACCAPVGLFFGRLANFINGELYGRVTNSWPGMVFPADRTQLPRHPSQLYEALLEGLVIFVVIYVFVKKTQALYKGGFVSGLFLIMYGAFRFIIEFVREPDKQVGYLMQYFTMGQLLCVPMVLLGLYLTFAAKKMSINSNAIK